MPLPGPIPQGSQVGAPDSSLNLKGCVQVERLAPSRHGPMSGVSLEQAHYAFDTVWGYRSGLCTFFCEGPNGKYSRLCRPITVAYGYVPINCF